MTVMNLPNKKYDIILADPAWSYRDKGLAGKRGASQKYQVMTLDHIMAMPINEIAADNCTLFMWHVPPMPLEALKVVEAWGFKLKTMKGFTWIKLNKLFAKVVQKHFQIEHEKLMLLDDAAVLALMHELTKMGMGHWTRANSEDCLIATRGKPKRISAAVKNTIFAPIGRHSAKPPVVHERIVQLMGDLPRIELFARERSLGWDAWGNDL